MRPPARIVGLAWRIDPVWILCVFVVGLALHNFVMAQLWQAGLRGAGLELVSAWKELLLALGLAVVLLRRGSLRFRPLLLDWLALAYGACVVVYGLIPSTSSGAPRATAASPSPSGRTCFRSPATSSGAGSGSGRASAAGSTPSSW